MLLNDGLSKVILQLLPTHTQNDDDFRKGKSGFSVMHPINISLPYTLFMRFFFFLLSEPETLYIVKNVSDYQAKYMQMLISIMFMWLMELMLFGLVCITVCK